MLARGGKAVTVAFSHEALFHAGTDGFLSDALPFIREGAEAGERVVVAVPAEHHGPLGDALAGQDGDVTLLEMERIGRNPAWIIPAWHDIVARALADGRPLRAIGEPVFPARTDEELVECHKHEALLDVAFGDGPGWRLVCPYDTGALAPESIATARGTHPLVLEGGAVVRSPDHVAPYDMIDGLDEPLSPPPAAARTLAFGAGDLEVVRRLTGAYALAAGLSADRRDE